MSPSTRPLGSVFPRSRNASTVSRKALPSSRPCGPADRAMSTDAINRCAAPPAASEELRRRGWIVGTPDQAASQLSAWSAVGIERVMFQWYHLEDLDGLALLAQLNQP